MSALEGATIAHVGIAVKDIEEYIRLWRDQLGLTFEGTDEVPGVKIAFFPLGEGSVELVQSTDPESGLAKFVEKTGGGMHHLCIRVKDIRAALAELKGKGVKLIDEEPRAGAHGHLVAFIHPKSTGGVLLELTQE
jgi:methylmalonyl-CoA/ethylmalonyl-CoA epimerase